MKIDAIYIACYKYDLRFTRILVASIRHWYPDIPVYLIKDRFYGDFDTSEIERHWNVSRLATDRDRFGWGFAKLEPLFLQGDQKGQRCLILDSDIALVGPVLEALAECKGDFVVQQENSAPEFVASHYFDLPGLLALDPKFVYPGFTFNTGQWVATTGLLKREDFQPCVDWKSSPPRVLHPEVFKLGEQGLLNYVLMKKCQEGALTLDHLRFMHVPGCEDCPDIELAQLRSDSPYPFLLHWCGRKRPRVSAMSLAAVLLHFERLYYSRIRFGLLRKWSRILSSRGEEAIRGLARKARLQRRPPASP